MAEASPNIFTKCLSAASTDIDSCGGATMCEVAPTSAEELVGIFTNDEGKFRAMEALLTVDFMGASCVREQEGMYAFLRATSRFLGPKKLQRSGLGTMMSQVWPFVMMGVKGPINREYWTISNGVVENGTAPNLADYTYRVDVSSQGSLGADVKWFPEKMRVSIISKTSGGTQTNTVWRIVDSVLQGSTVRLYTVGENSASFMDAAALTPPTTYGLLTRGTVNVADPDIFCARPPAINTNQSLPFWYETDRYDLCDSQLTQDYMKALRENNKYYERFINVPQMEYNRQVIEDHQQRQVWQAFFGKALPNQDLQNWGQLQEITFPETDLVTGYEGVCIGRRANAIGLLELMAECGRYKDLQGNVLNLPELFADIREMMRMRQSIKSPMDRVFELWMPSAFRPYFWAGMLRYWKGKSQDMLRLTHEMQPALEQAKFGFAFWRFQLDEPAVEIRLVSHKALDDFSDAIMAAAPVAEGASPLANQANFIWIFDWSVTYLGQINSNAVTNRSGTLAQQAAVNPALMCAMQVPTISRKLVSNTWTVVVECPKTGLMIHGIPNEVPEWRAMSGVYYDLYGAAGE